MSFVNYLKLLRFVCYKCLDPLQRSDRNTNTMKTVLVSIRNRFPPITELQDRKIHQNIKRENCQHLK
ncbi:unnamed protein product [Acanthoscelides obtectus]|uniref:Uncharacterized protein n=1 Tax=Acanthoscelides obtectus TaxID=200917 RepID=A0A9P0PE37_ACAOB|nr:unnamed protein product [Acanthoscelides obtectus]CAK1631923.1 hypothetical protein AOBTE_LOCUS7240 [Acanthoscelides obtectus]